MPRKRKSVEEHKKNGTYRPSRHDLPVISKEVINPVPFIPLTEWGHEFFLGLCGDLREDDKLAPEDLYTVSIMAQLATVIKDTYEILKKEGYFSPGSSGQVTQNPAWQIYKGALQEFNKMADKMGMGPVNRLRMAINQKSVKKEEKQPSINLD